MKRTILTAAILTIVAVSLSGCSASDPKDGSGTATKSLSAIQKSGSIVVGTEGTYRPFSYHEGGAGKLTGYDVEVIEAVAAELGVKATFKEAAWDGLLTGLSAGRFDVIANQVTVNTERKADYELSTPYTYSTGVIVVPSDNESITSFDSLAGKTTAQSLKSSWYAMAEKSGATVESVEGWAQSVALVEQGRVDATLNDRLTYLDYKKQNGAKGLKVAAETTDRAESVFAFAKGGTKLAKAVDTALVDLAADGTLAKLSDKYFGEDVSK